jgi:hypothetical protein
MSQAGHIRGADKACAVDGGVVRESTIGHCMEKRRESDDILKKKKRL